MCDIWLILVLLPKIDLVLRSRGILTERVVAHPIAISPISLDFFYDRWKSNYLHEQEFIPT